MGGVERSELAQYPTERMIPSDLVVPIGAHDQGSGLTHSSAEEANEIECGGVCPVHILEDHDDGALGISESVEDRCEELVPASVLVEDIVKTGPGKRGDVREGTEGSRGGQWVTCPEQHRCPLVDSLAKGTHDGGLARACLTREQGERPIAGPGSLEQCIERRQHVVSFQQHHVGDRAYASMTRRRSGEPTASFVGYAQFMFPCARFDDLSPDRERSFALRGLQEEVIARTADEVIPALERIRELTGRGLWAGGYVGYEAAPGFDASLRVRRRHLGDPFHRLPMLWFGLYKRREALAALEPRQIHPAPYSVSAWTPTTNQADYAAAIDRIRDHIADGDTYQVNHTFRLRAAFSGDPFELYRDLMLAQRGAYGACFDAGRYRVVSASPERFFRIEGGRIEVRPMKGTTRRGRWPEEDEQLGLELLASEKDRAENLMIVDLLRNDLGRIAEFGSVSVDHLVQLERYETVWQLTSQISANLRKGADVVDVFRALFPSGSVTGAPKASTMGIISELEHTPRGVYCGAVGYIAPPGVDGPDADFNVAIRTVIVDQDEGLAEYGVGGGITWDSVSTAEYEEARLKSALLVERRPDFDLLETLRWDDTQGYWWLDEHLERIADTAAYFGYRFDEGHAREALAAAVGSEVGARLVRMTVGRQGNRRGARHSRGTRADRQRRPNSSRHRHRACVTPQRVPLSQDHTAAPLRRGGGTSPRRRRCDPRQRGGRDHGVDHRQRRRETRRPMVDTAPRLGAPRRRLSQRPARQGNDRRASSHCG